MAQKITPFQLAGTLYDELQATFVLFADFVGRHLPGGCCQDPPAGAARLNTLTELVSLLAFHRSTVDVLKSRIPNVADLISVYHLDPACAFAVWRPLYRAHIQAGIEELGGKGKGHAGYIIAAKKIFSQLCEEVKTVLPEDVGRVLTARRCGPLPGGW